MIEDSIIENYFSSLENEYLPNPYHNSTHGVDVMNSFIYLVSYSQILNCISSVEILGCVIATLGHDVGHPGLNNRFLVNIHDPLAIRFNDN